MSYTLSNIHPDDRRGMAQVRALLEQEGREQNLDIRAQREDIFNAMHRI